MTYMLVPQEHSPIKTGKTSLLNSLRQNFPRYDGPLMELWSNPWNENAPLQRQEFDLIIAASRKPFSGTIGKVDRHIDAYGTDPADNYLAYLPKDPNGNGLLEYISNWLAEDINAPIITLDIGAGQGNSYFDLERLYPDEFHSGKLRPHLISLHDLRNQLPENLVIPNDNYHVLDARDLDKHSKRIAPQGFDIIFSAQAIYHLKPLAQLKLVEDIYNSLKIGGIAFLHVDHFQRDLVNMIPRLQALGYNFYDVNALTRQGNWYSELLFTRGERKFAGIPITLSYTSEFNRLLHIVRDLSYQAGSYEEAVSNFDILQDCIRLEIT